MNPVRRTKVFLRTGYRYLRDNQKNRGSIVQMQDFRSVFPWRNRIRSP